MRKKLLILACGDYSEPLGKLLSVIPDAKRLGDLLAKRNIGHFSVTQVFNPNLIEAQIAVHDLLSTAHGADLIALYMSGHGVKDSHGRFYLALPATDLDKLAATALSGRYIREQMADTPARKVLLILDACYAGAFTRDMIAKAAPAITGLPDELVNERGHVVMAAASAIQYAFETTAHGPSTSIFTKMICEGIESGEADLNADGWISLEELFNYTSEKMSEESTAQKPEASYLGVTGQIPIARTPKATLSAELESEINLALDSPHVELRLAAAKILGGYAKGNNRQRAYIARARLRSLRNDESDEIRQMVSSLLGRTYRHRHTTVDFKAEATTPASDEWASLDGRALKLAGEQVPRFASFGKDVPALTTVALRLTGSRLEIFATDRHRLEWRRLNPLAHGSKTFSVYVSANDFSALKKVPAEADIHINIYEREICFSVATSVLRMRRELRYTFPQIDHIIQMVGAMCNVRRLDVIEGIESLIGDRRTRLDQAIVISSTPSSRPALRISADGTSKLEERGPQIDIPAKGVVQDTTIRLDHQQFLEALDSFEEESIYIQLPHNTGPVLIMNAEKDASHRHAIMPLEANDV